MPLPSRTNSMSTGASGSYPYSYSPAPANDTSRSSQQVDAIIMMVKEQEQEAKRLRDGGQLSAAMDRYRVVIKLCGDASSKVGRGPMAEVWSEKKLQLQQELADLAATGRYVPPNRRGYGEVTSPRAVATPASPTSPLAPPEGLRPGVEQPVVAPPPRVGGFRTPQTGLRLDEATWGEISAYTRKLKDQADLIRPTDLQGAISRLREAADIWNYVASSPRFQLLGSMQQTAREVADNYMLHANALTNPNGGAVHAVNGPGSGQVEAAEIDRRVRDCIVHDTPNNKIGWAQIVGSQEAKNALQSALIDRYIYKGAPDNEARGVLLYGPAGTGKTMLVRGVVNMVSELLERHAKKQAEKRAQKKAEESLVDAPEKSLDGSNSPTEVSENDTQERAPKAITLFKVTSGDCDSKYVGDGPKFMQTLFKLAREEQPSVIFFDEVDALFSKRQEGQNEATAKIMTQFMQEIDGLTSTGNITVIAASNQPQKLDDAVLRRLQRDVYVPAPGPEDRAKILAQQLKCGGVPFDIAQEKIHALATSKDMENFTGADIKLVLKKAREQGPERELHEAQAFREVDGEMEPCTPDAPDAKLGGYLDFFGEDFKQLPIKYEHLAQAARTHRPTASKQIPVLEKWKADLEASKL